MPNVPDLTEADGVGHSACCRMSSSRIHSLFTMTNSSANRRFRQRRNQELSGFGGARRDRTDDLKLAKLPLSQLSYGPVRHHGAMKLVGLGGFEPPTSRLSSARSNQLSYRPKANRLESRPAKAWLGPECMETRTLVQVDPAHSPGKRKRNEDGEVPHVEA